MVRISVSSDGKYVKAKARGRSRMIWKTPFRDELKRLSFKTMRSVLENLSFQGLKEEPLRRGIRIRYEANGELCTRIVSTVDTVLSACPPPSLSPFKDSLRGEEPVKFVYLGHGHFRVFLPEDADDDESRTLGKFMEDFVNPLYTTTFAGRLSEPQTKGIVEFCAEKLSGQIESVRGENKTQTIAEEEEITPMIKETILDKVQPSETHPAPHRRTRLSLQPSETTAQPISKLEEKPISTEEMKKEIAEYHPTTFRERAAYGRYREALTRPWARGSEEEIHKLFYNLIRGRHRPEDFEHYYNQLYRLAPGWLDAISKQGKRGGRLSRLVSDEKYVSLK